MLSRISMNNYRKLVLYESIIYSSLYCEMYKEEVSNLLPCIGYNDKKYILSRDYKTA